MQIISLTDSLKAFSLHRTTVFDLCFLCILFSLLLHNGSNPPTESRCLRNILTYLSPFNKITKKKKVGAGQRARSIPLQQHRTRTLRRQPVKSLRVRRPGRACPGSAPPTKSRLEDSIENVPAVVQRSEWIPSTVITSCENTQSDITYTFALHALGCTDG